jgi:hypothetical protein
MARKMGSYVLAWIEEKLTPSSLIFTRVSAVSSLDFHIVTVVKEDMAQ